MNNFQHPEQLTSEVFVSNVLLQDCDWEQIKWKTKRLGKQAYDRDGNPIIHYRPVLAKVFEVERFQMFVNQIEGRR